MPKYIDKDSLYERLEKRYHQIVENYSDVDAQHYTMGFREAINCLKNEPAADAQEVRHAKWAHLGGEEWCCSCCGFIKITEGSWEKPSAKYCEECGAKMELEGGNAEIY